MTHPDAFDPDDTASPAPPPRRAWENLHELCLNALDEHRTATTATIAIFVTNQGHPELAPWVGVVLERHERNGVVRRTADGWRRVRRRAAGYP